ncbi:hypothetical protein SNE40_017515 [Patella caerulea]|uniref:Endonuclease/exonuclease/phosphatase domain-containing protein n=1 Tax=Patella caerulea TaxID=87958 RepID=A0AAN8PE88_PATCE
MFLNYNSGDLKVLNDRGLRLFNPDLTNLLKLYGIFKSPNTRRGKRGGKNINSRNKPFLDSKSSKNYLNVCLLNIRSLGDKCELLAEYLTEEHSDTCLLSETWLSLSTSGPVTSDFKKIGYVLEHTPRPSRGGCVDILFKSSLKIGYVLEHTPRPSRGGCVDILFKSSLKCEKKKCSTFKSFETIEFLLKANAIALRFVAIYRPPNSSLTNFFADFSEYYETLILKSGHLIITGDFNIHVDILSDPVLEKFKDLLQSFGLSQHVISPTHRQGHTLDLVITQIDDTLSLERLYVKDPCLSDHNAVHFSLPPDNRPLSAKPVSIQCRKYKSINNSIFTERFLNTISCLRLS